MRNIFIFIRDQIDIWWDFLCDTQVPGCTFSFGAVVIFLLLVDGALVLLRIVLFNSPGGGDVHDMNKLIRDKRAVRAYKNQFKK